MSSSEKTISTFDRHADQYREKYMTYGPYVETYAYLSKLLKPGAEVLDVACGPGNISSYLLENDPTVKIHGIDLSPRMLELASENCPDARFEIFDSRNINSLDNQYDAIVSGFCCPYLNKKEVESFVADARAILRPNGVLYLSTIEGKHEESAGLLHEQDDGLTTYYYESEFLLTLMESNQFETLRLERKHTNSGTSTEATDLFIYARAI